MRGLRHFIENKSAFLQTVDKASKALQHADETILLKTGSQIVRGSVSHFAPDYSKTWSPQTVTLHQMMACSMHMGHTPSRWNPKMAPFIFGEHAGIHVIDLEKTIACLRQACQAVLSIAATGKAGGCILFVGTSENIQRITYESAMDCGQFYVNKRWIGGTLTNRTQVLRNDKLIPDLMIVLDPVQNQKAIKEAEDVNVPVVAICDTNFDPSSVTYPIPANDDATPSVELIARSLSHAAAEGLRRRSSIRSSEILVSGSQFIDSIFRQSL